MNLIYFIRLVLKNVFLIGGVAVLMAVLVFMMTRGQPESYSSEMVIYTGLATGYDIESGADARYDHFMTNAKFDNLINIIKSRQTLEETAIRLMTQHLLLESPDKRFCSRETWDAIQTEAPREIRSLLHYSGGNLSNQGFDMPSKENSLPTTQVDQDKDKAQSLETENQDQDSSPSQSSLSSSENLNQDSTPKTRLVTKTVYETKTVTEKVERTRTKPKYYTVMPGDYPIGIASKHGMTVDQLKAINKPEAFPLQGGQKLLVGATRETYYVDSLVKREVPVEVTVEEPIEGYEYDNTDYSYQPDDQDINDPNEDDDLESSNPSGSDNFTDFKSRVDPIEQFDSISNNFSEIYNDALSHVQAFERSVRNLIKYKERDEVNYIYTTLQSSNSVYGIEKISKIKASRMQNSDLLRLSYDNNDPGVCQQTLLIVYDVFRQGFQSIKGSQTSMVTDYFRAQRDAAKIRLDSLEEYNKQYRMKHRIINYNEQTKFVAEQNEVLDRDWYEESGKLSASIAALNSIEQQMDEYSKNLVQRGEIINLRNEIGRLTRLISAEEIRLQPDINLLARYKQDKQRVQTQLDEFITSSFRTTRTTEGIDMQSVLSLWISKVIEVEESRARYKVKSEQKKEFMGKYDKFAPLGSTLTKIEREIDLAEQEYLNQTHSLDLSLLKQKNSEQSNIKIIDEPYYPIKPNPSKRMFTVIAAFMAGLFLTTAVIILLEFIDTSIKFPQRAEELSKSKLIGALPKMPRKADPRIDYKQITTRLIDMLTQKIKLEELQVPHGDRPFMILLMSTRKLEGKTFVGSKIVQKLRSIGHKVLFIKPFDHSAPEEFEEQFRRANDQVVAWDFEYEVPDNFMSIRNINELLRNFSFMTRGYQYIFIELPSLLNSDFPATLVSKADLSILVCRATRSWNQADDEVLDIYKKNAGHKVFSMINGVQVDNLEPIIGEIPRQRSLIRRIAKRIVSFDFKISKSL